MKRGMTRVKVETFPKATVLIRSQAAEDAMKTVLLECAAALSPRIEQRKEDTAFLCGIDIAGTAKLFGAPEEVAGALLRGVRAVGIKAASQSAAISMLLLAWLKVSFDGPYREITTGDERAALAHLPMSVLDLSEAQTEAFELWGIRTFGMVGDLPEDGLIARMGQEGKRLQQLARGELPHLFEPVEPPCLLEERMELDSPVELLDSLLFVISVMLNHLILRAKARMVALASITITLMLDRGGSHIRTVRPALSSNDKQLWLKPYSCYPVRR
jgi:protein ImuB